ncbi:MAG: hypothetical protein CBC48_09615 [bacterium TMED88]|nr:ArsR family transcriptional regulator [Deltaproteobacteria bacterium]OUV31585.1 MAG: hypothetical protein CBC48_09615 [bacterium TMED88]
MTTASAADELQRVFKVLSDPTRMRILRILEREELVVQEIMEILAMAQSRISRHLAILREAGLLQDRRDGTYVFYRFIPPTEGPWRDGWTLIRERLDGDPTSDRDDTLLKQIVLARSQKSRNFFDAIGPEWDALRKVFNDDALRARAIARLVPAGLRVADIGTGTGILACELAKLGLGVIGVDHSSRMLEAAESNLAAQGTPVGSSVELRQGEADQIPISTDGVDAAFAHMVLHYIPNPADVIREMSRVVQPGGIVVVVDFVRHAHEWMRGELGVLWMGFEPQEMRTWFESAGLPGASIEEISPAARERDLPATLVASVRVPHEGHGPALL